MALKHTNVMYFSFFLEQCGLRARNLCGLETELLFSWLCLQVTNLTITVPKSVLFVQCHLIAVHVCYYPG